jgi:hypothetical protein
MQGGLEEAEDTGVAIEPPSTPVSKVGVPSALISQVVLEAKTGTSALQENIAQAQETTPSGAVMETTLGIATYTEEPSSSYALETITITQETSLELPPKSSSRRIFTSSMV